MHGGWMRSALVAMAVGTLAAACGSGSAPSDRPSPGDTHLLRELPDRWADRVDNPWLPLTPGSRWEYRTTTPDGKERTVVTVLRQTRNVAGVRAVVVHDRVTSASGRLIEDTHDWYAQDRTGTVWYLGEATTAFGKGKPTHEGSWEAGVNGAKAGIAMLGKPRAGASYQQEFYRGHAEDQGEVLAVNASAKGPIGKWSGVVKTRDTTPLEPDVIEYKYYVRGIGLVEERAPTEHEHTVLVAFKRG